jgi:hypothetical protein
MFPGGNKLFLQISTNIIIKNNDKFWFWRQDIFSTGNTILLFCIKYKENLYRDIIFYFYYIWKYNYTILECTMSNIIL